MKSPQVADGRNVFHILWIAENISNNQSWTVDRRWSSRSAVAERLPPPCKKTNMLWNVIQSRNMADSSD
jgi:hypothetical protein